MAETRRLQRNVNAWRMSLRVGSRGFSMWERCRALGVAALTYDPITHVDLSHNKIPATKWSELAPAQKASLTRLVYEMKGGDVIYVREGDKIVGRGTVRGTSGARAYRFDSKFGLRNPYGTPWAHQVPVSWSPDFPLVPNSLGRDQLTVLRLSPTKVRSWEKVVFRVRRQNKPNALRRGRELETRLKEETYFRETPANLKVIIPRHKKLSNEFRDWLGKKYGIGARQEQGGVDVRFDVCERAHLAELKICYRAGTRKSVREALGQVLEYNLYPAREATEEWLIVLDVVPSADDKRFIDALRGTYSLPVVLGWKSRRGFLFRPNWPNRLILPC